MFLCSQEWSKRGSNLLRKTVQSPAPTQVCYSFWLVLFWGFVFIYFIFCRACSPIFWSIIDLQCCIHFFCTPYLYAYIFFFIFFPIAVCHRVLNYGICKDRKFFPFFLWMSCSQRMTLKLKMMFPLWTSQVSVVFFIWSVTHMYIARIIYIVLLPAK